MLRTSEKINQCLKYKADPRDPQDEQEHRLLPTAPLAAVSVTHSQCLSEDIKWKLPETSNSRVCECTALEQHGGIWSHLSCPAQNTASLCPAWIPGGHLKEMPPTCVTWQCSGCSHVLYSVMAPKHKSTATRTGRVEGQNSGTVRQRAGREERQQARRWRGPI